MRRPKQISSRSSPWSFDAQGLKPCVPTIIQDRRRREFCCSLLPPPRFGGEQTQKNPPALFGRRIVVLIRGSQRSSGKQEAERTVEVEEVEQVGDRRAVQRNVGAVRQGDRVRIVVAA